LLTVLTGFGCSKGGSSDDPVPPPTNQPQNRNPVIISNLKLNADEEDNYFAKVDATDPDGDSLNFSLTRTPTGMTINSNDGSVIWPNAQEGSFPLEVKVNDLNGGSASQSGTLVVNNKFSLLSGEIA